MANVSPNSILIVDDDLFAFQSDALDLRARGFRVRQVGTVVDAKAEVSRDPPDLAIIDIRLPMGEPTESRDERLASRGGFYSGQVFAQWIKDHFPGIKVLGMSAAHEPDVVRWFSNYTEGFIGKHDLLLTGSLAQLVEPVILGSMRPKLPRPFIVHGHDEAARRELKDYLQNRLGFLEPIVLHEQPSLGRTILEKFEDEAKAAALVFVLLTPDDAVVQPGDGNSDKRRARQNVIFELGFFLGSLGRKNGRVLLLYKGQLELPSDISGLVYIDISRGVEAAGEVIRRELEDVALGPTGSGPRVALY